MNDFLGINAHLYKSISSRNSIKVLYSNVCHIGSNILHFSLKHFSHYFRLMYVAYVYIVFMPGALVCLSVWSEVQIVHMVQLMPHTHV